MSPKPVSVTLKQLSPETLDYLYNGTTVSLYYKKQEGNLSKSRRAAEQASPRIIKQEIKVEDPPMIRRVKMRKGRVVQPKKPPLAASLTVDTNWKERLGEFNIDKALEKSDERRLMFASSKQGYGINWDRTKSNPVSEKLEAEKMFGVLLNIKRNNTDQLNCQLCAKTFYGKLSSVSILLFLPLYPHSFGYICCDLLYTAHSC